MLAVEVIRDYSFFLSRLQAVTAPVISMASLPSSICTILPSGSITNVVRLAMPAEGISTPYSAETLREKSLRSGYSA